MYSFSLLLLTLVISAICPTLKASFPFSEDKHSTPIKCTYPKIETKYASEINEKEVELLHQGIKNFTEGRYSYAYNIFVEALLAYGSPLAYLYAGALTENDNLGIEYFSFAINALNCNAISQPTFDEHLQYIKEKGFINIEG